MTKKNKEVLEKPQQDKKTKEPELKVEPRVEARAERAYVSIPIEVTLKEWSKVNGLFEEIFEWLGKKGIQPNGAPFYRYLAIGDIDNEFKMEVGVPVANIAFGDERVRAGTIPKGKYAILEHIGHPDRLVNTLSTMEEWAKKREIEWDKKIEGDREFWEGRLEHYLTDPAIQPDFEKWTIEVAIKIKDSARIPSK